MTYYALKILLSAAIIVAVSELAKSVLRLVGAPASLPLTSLFAESTVNQVISRWMVKKHQMRWSKRGAHLLLQISNADIESQLTEDILPVVSWCESGELGGEK